MTQHEGRTSFRRLSVNAPDQGTGGTRKSTFVTVVAWIFIVLAGLMTLVSVLQNIMVFTMFPAERVASQFDEAPALVRFMFAHFRTLVLLGLIASCATLVSAVGLLKRRNWARIVFIALMALGIGYQVFGVVWVISFVSWDLPGMAGGLPAAERLMVRLITAFTTVMALGIALLFAWIIKKLVSPEIRGEFIRRTVT